MIVGAVEIEDRAQELISGKGYGNDLGQGI